MKKNLILLLISFTVYCCGQDKSNIDWKSDIEYLKTELPRRHYNLFFKIPKEEFEARLNALSEQVDHLGNFDVMLKLNQIIAAIGDSHTTINSNKFIKRDKFLPLHLYWFKDGLYVLGTIKEYEDMLGKKIVKINGYGINQITDSLSTLITVDNNAIVESKIPKMIPLVQLLEYFSFVENDIINIQVESLDGITSKHAIKISANVSKDKVRFRPDSLAFCWRNEKAFFKQKYFEKDSIYYILYNRCNSKEVAEKRGNHQKAKRLPSFKEFEEKVFTTIETKPIKKLVFDMRLNGGGNSNQGTEFIKKLSTYSNINQEDKLFVVIGRHTFSSAILNTMDFQKYTKAILVGEETGGKPNHYGEIKKFELPSSQATVKYSTKYFTRSDKDLNTITPDIEIRTSFSDFKSGIDPVYEWIKTYNP